MLRGARCSAEITAGWRALADGWWDWTLDPIVAARAAYRASIDPANQEEAKRLCGGPAGLEASPVLDDWVIDDWLIDDGNAHGVSSEEGATVLSLEFIERDPKDKWIRTRDGVYRLGCPRGTMPLIVGAILCATWRQAYEHIFAATGEHTLTSANLAVALAVGRSGATVDERRRAANHVAGELLQDGRRSVAKAWSLLGADPADATSACEIYGFLRDAPTWELHPAFEVVTSWWCACANGAMAKTTIEDPIAAAHASVKRPCDDLHLDPNEIDPGPESASVIVLAKVGGTTGTISGREAANEFKTIVGQRLPLALAVVTGVVQARLHDEFPHLRREIDQLLASIIDDEPIAWRPTLLVGAPGGGKTRLARRLAELLGVGLHRYDASGSADNTFGGTPRRWSSGEHCVPLEAIRRFAIANPFVLVDEIDKAGSSPYHGSVDRALLPFLEPESAKCYPDPYLQTGCDLSRVGYILTANNVTALSGPLRDRLRIVRLPQPSVEHLPALVRGIVAEVAQAGGDRRWYPMLSDGELAVAEGLWRGGSVRRLRAIVERVLAYRETNARN